MILVWIQERRKISGHIDEFYKKYLTTDETRYTEIFICVDNEMVSTVYHNRSMLCFLGWLSDQLLLLSPLPSILPRFSYEAKIPHSPNQYSLILDN